MSQQKYFKYFPIILFLVLMLNPAVAQNIVQISGKVVDQNNKPLELVSVAVKNSTLGTTTDFQGCFELESIVQDSLVLMFSSLGYETEEYVINSENKFPLRITLLSAALQIETVTIEENRLSDLTMNRLSPMSAKGIAGASGNGVQDLLVTLPGVSSTNEMSSQYSVRGGNFDENLVYVNGVEIYRPLLVRSGQQEGLSFINPALVSNIAFSSGGYDAQYGDKMSSVLDIKYRVPTEFAASAEISLLGASAHLESVSKNQKFTQLHGLRYKSSAYLFNTLDTDAEYNPIYVDYQTLLSYKFNDNLSLSFLGNYSFNRYTFTPKTRETVFGAYNNAQKLKIYFDGWENDLFQSLTAAFTLKYSPSSKSNYHLTATAYKTDENENFDISGEYWLEDTKPVGDSGIEAEKEIAVAGYMEHARNELDINVNTLTIGGTHNSENERHLISWGNTFQLENINDNINEWTLRDSSGYSQSPAKEALELYEYYNSNNNILAFRTHGYLQDRYLKNYLSVTYGLRYSYWSFNNEFTLSPRASVAYTLDKRNYFRFSTGLYSQTPFYKEIRNRDGKLNREIKAQKSIHLVLGYDHFFTMWNRPFKYTAEAYYKYMSDLIPYDVDNMRIEYYGANMAKGYAVGIENRIYGEFVPGVDSWLGLTIMKTSEKLDGTDEFIPRPTDQRYNFTMFFQDYLPRNNNYKAHLRMIFGGGLPFWAPNEYKSSDLLRSKAYQRVDLGLSRQFTNDKMQRGVLKRIWIDIEVLNLFGIYNVNSYFWVSGINNKEYAVPNYLTGRRFNLKISAYF